MSSKAGKSTKIHILKPGTVLVIDDDPLFRGEIKEVLADERFEVVALESANHALRFLQRQPWNWYPWLIITDLVMDGMGGYELMRRLAEMYPGRDIPIIVISRLGSAEDMSEAEMAGAQAYLKKPVEPITLLNTIKKVTSKVGNKKQRPDFSRPF